MSIYFFSFSVPNSKICIYEMHKKLIVTKCKQKNSPDKQDYFLYTYLLKD